MHSQRVIHMTHIIWMTMEDRLRALNHLHFRAFVSIIQYTNVSKNAYSILYFFFVCGHFQDIQPITLHMCVCVCAALCGIICKSSSRDHQPIEC